MKIVFFSNYLSPHQKPFCEEMYHLLGENYKFISCEPFSINRKQMGWVQPEKQLYELRPYEAEEEYLKAKELAEYSDIMIWGSAKYEFVQIRRKSGKISIRYSERLFKKGLLSSIKSLDIFRQVKFNFNTRSKNSFLFCASAYSPFDFLLSLGKFKQIYKWGYYPKTLYYDIEQLMNNKSDSQEVTFLWAGRMLELKHPEIAIYLADCLRNRGIKFVMKIVGSGELRLQIEKAVFNKQLTNYVEVLGAMSTEEVRVQMEHSDFFLFTSDYNEGWGAVLNESMNSGCVVVCSDEVGAARYLINEGQNGFLFKRNHLEKMVDVILALISDPGKRKEIGINAYKTITNLWSAQIASERFCEWCENLVKGNEIAFKEGPMSQAKVTIPKGNWWIR